MTYECSSGCDNWWVQSPACLTRLTSSTQHWNHDISKTSEFTGSCSFSSHGVCLWPLPEPPGAAWPYCSQRPRRLPSPCAGYSILCKSDHYFLLPLHTAGGGQLRRFSIPHLSGPHRLSGACVPTRRGRKAWLTKSPTQDCASLQPKCCDAQISALVVKSPSVPCDVPGPPRGAQAPTHSQGASITAHVLSKFPI